MIRPRFTLARLALASAGLLTAAGIGAAAVPQVLASSPAAATSAPPALTTTPAPGQKPGNPRRHLAGLALRHELVTLVATTGLTAKQVHAQVRAGRSLDAIAGSKAQAVRDAALDAVTKRLDAARAKGTITAAQETKLVARAKARIVTVMAATPHPRATAAA